MGTQFLEKVSKIVQKIKFFEVSLNIIKNQVVSRIFSLATALVIMHLFQMGMW